MNIDYHQQNHQQELYYQFLFQDGFLLLLKASSKLTNNHSMHLEIYFQDSIYNQSKILEYSIHSPIFEYSFNGYLSSSLQIHLHEYAELPLLFLIIVLNYFFQFISTLNPKYPNYAQFDFNYLNCYCVKITIRICLYM